jgi:tyrosinase
MARLRLLLLIPLACLAHTLVLAQYSAYNYGFDVTKRVKRQLSQRSAMVVSDKSGSGNVVVRQEIRQLEQDQDLWTLYILGLSMLQFTDQSSPTSYYGLAGLCFPAAISADYQGEISDCLS